MVKLSDFIGCHIRVLYHSDPNLVGREGVVIFETSKMLIIQDKKSSKRIMVYKRNGVFEVNFKGKRGIIYGHKMESKIQKRLSRGEVFRL